MNEADTFDPETLLRALLKEGFFESEGLIKGILWGWREDVTIADVLSKELEQELRKYMPKERV